MNGEGKRREGGKRKQGNKGSYEMKRGEEEEKKAGDGARDFRRTEIERGEVQYGIDL